MQRTLGSQPTRVLRRRDRSRRGSSSPVRGLGGETPLPCPPSPLSARRHSGGIPQRHSLNTHILGRAWASGSPAHLHPHDRLACSHHSLPRPFPHAWNHRLVCQCRTPQGARHLEQRPAPLLLIVFSSCTVSAVTVRTQSCVLRANVVVDTRSRTSPARPCSRYSASWTCVSPTPTKKADHVPQTQQVSKRVPQSRAALPRHSGVSPSFRAGLVDYGSRIGDRVYRQVEEERGVDASVADLPSPNVTHVHHLQVKPAARLCPRLLQQLPVLVNVARVRARA